MKQWRNREEQRLESASIVGGRGRSRIDVCVRTDKG